MVAVALERWHVRSVIERQRERDRIETHALTGGRDNPDALADGSRFGVAILDHGGVPQVCFGLVPLSPPGSGVLWMLATDAWPYMWREVYRVGRRIIQPMVMDDPEFRRVQAMVCADNEPARRFAERFGLHAEGLHRSVGVDGSDWWTMARVLHGRQAEGSDSLRRHGGAGRAAAANRAAASVA